MNLLLELVDLKFVAKLVLKVYLFYVKICSNIYGNQIRRFYTRCSQSA
jgi:hypothetical protein